MYFSDFFGILCSDMTTKCYPSKSDIGQRIRERREYLKIPRQKMAELLGIGLTGYSHKETGLREIGSTELPIIARALGVSTDYLLGEENATDLRQQEIVRFYNGLPEPIQRAELEHMRALHRAHVEETGPRAIASRSREALLLEDKVPDRNGESSYSSPSEG